MTTTLCAMLGEPSIGSLAGMASRGVAGRLPAYGAGAVSPVIPAIAGVVAWRKTTAAGTRVSHQPDAAFATPVGSGGSG